MLEGFSLGRAMATHAPKGTRQYIGLGALGSSIPSSSRWVRQIPQWKAPRFSRGRRNANCCRLSLFKFFYSQTKERNMSVSTLEDLFLHEIKDIYDGEKRLLKALPKMAKAASSEELKAAFEEHLAVTEQQVARLEQIFADLGKPARGKKCMGMEGLIEEGSELMKEDAEEPVMDAGLIAAAQKVEHYEIATYGTLATYAKILGLDNAHKLLKATLAEEKETDEKLSELASQINFEAEVAGKS
jgi:ferritin-like metal-binding protein YciE